MNTSMLFRLLLAALVLWLLPACTPEPIPQAQTAPTVPTVQLPSGSPHAGKPLQVATATAMGTVATDGRYTVPLPKARAQLVFVTVGPATAADQPVVLLRIARPGVQGNIDAKSTATALIMMAPFVVRSEPEVLALLEPLVAGLEQTTAFAKAIEDLLRAGKSLDSLADDPKAAAAYTAAVEATLAAMAKASQAAGDTKMGALTVAPEESQSQIQVVAGGNALALVRNWGSRWVTVWAGQPGTDEFLGIVEPAPKTLSLDNVVAVATQGTLWPYEENSLDLTGYGKADLRFYGPGLQPAAAGCTSPGLGDRRLLVPTIATLFDNFVSPAMEIVLGLDLAGTKPWQDFLIGLTISLGTDEDLLDAVVSSPVKWGQAAKAVGLACIKQAFNTAMEIGFKTVDTKLGIGKAGPKFASLKTAFAHVVKGNGKDIKLLELSDNWFVHVAASLGMGALQIAAKGAVLPIKLVSVIGAAVDTGKAFGTLATTKPAECFAVTVDSTCGDNDGDGFTPLPKPLLGCTSQTGDCNDAQKAQHPGVAELCDLVDNDCNGQTDEVPAAQLASDINNCGQCGKSCLAGQTCTKGKCGAAAFSDPTDKQTTAVNVTVTQVEQAQGGKVKVFASVQTQSGDPIEQLTTGNFGIEETVNGVSISVPVNSLEIAEESSNGLRAALVIDSSGSMYTSPEPSALELAKAAAKEFVSYLKPGDEVAVVDFSSQVIVQQGLTNNKQALFTAIDACDQGGGTAMFDGAEKGLDLLATQTGQRAVLLLTDGEDTASTCGDSSQCIAGVVNAAKQQGTPVYAIGLGLTAGSPGESDLLALAQGSNAGGKGIGYYYAPAGNQLKALYEKLATILKKTYVVGWYTTAKPGQKVSAKVKVTYSSATGQLTDTFDISFVGQ